MLRMKHVSPGPIEWLPVHSLSTARERCCAVLRGAARCWSSKQMTPSWRNVGTDFADGSALKV